MNKPVLYSVISSFISGLLNAIIYIISIADTIPSIGFIVFMSFSGALVVLGFVIFWGLPMHFLLRYYKKESVGWYVLIGAIPAVVVPLDSFFGAGYTNLIGHTFFAAYVGITASLSFVYMFQRKSA